MKESAEGVRGLTTKCEDVVLQGEQRPQERASLVSRIHHGAWHISDNECGRNQCDCHLSDVRALFLPGESRNLCLDKDVREGGTICHLLGALLTAPQVQLAHKRSSMTVRGT